MIKDWIDEIKKTDKEGRIGMILVHNGVVRATSKDGRAVCGMRLDFDAKRLESVLNEFQNTPGVFHIKVWINRGDLRIGDDIMFILVAGRTRAEVLSTLERLLERIKREVVKEEEIYLNP